MQGYSVVMDRESCTSFWYIYQKFGEGRFSVEINLAIQNELINEFRDFIESFRKGEDFETMFLDKEGSKLSFYKRVLGIHKCNDCLGLNFHLEEQESIEFVDNLEKQLDLAEIFYES